MDKMRKILAAGVAAISLTSCGEKTFDVDGVKVTQAQCRADLEHLDASISRVLEIGKLAAERKYASKSISTMIMLEQSALNQGPREIPTHKIGSCGEKARAAFGQFTSLFAYGLGMENEIDYAARPPHEKDKLKKFAMKRISEARAELDNERARLKKMVDG